MPVTNTLRHARLSRHLRQDELAAAVRTDGRTISRYETGERCPSLEMALRLSFTLGISIDELFTLDDTADFQIRRGD